jgi:DNA-directed RNA polymerase specialized sigma24 family protein
MSERRDVGHEAFAKWELELAKGKAKGLMGRYGVTAEDVVDIEQELLLHIHVKRTAFSCWEQRTASDRTILSRVLDNKIRDIIESGGRQKRKVRMLMESLDQPISVPDAEEPIPLGSQLADKNLQVGSPEGFDLALSLACEYLTDIQRRVLALLSDGHNVSETAKALGMKRTTLNREIGRMRRTLYEKGLRDYV